MCKLRGRDSFAKKLSIGSPFAIMIFSWLKNKFLVIGLLKKSFQLFRGQSFIKRGFTIENILQTEVPLTYTHLLIYLQFEYQGEKLAHCFFGVKSWYWSFFIDSFLY